MICTAVYTLHWKERAEGGVVDVPLGLKRRRRRVTSRGKMLLVQSTTSTIYIYQQTKMADEEVDWGVDEVLEANAVDAAIATDDVLSLGGDEGSSIISRYYEAHPSFSSPRERRG